MGKKIVRKVDVFSTALFVIGIIGIIMSAILVASNPVSPLVAVPAVIATVLGARHLTVQVAYETADDEQDLRSTTGEVTRWRR